MNKNIVMMVILVILWGLLFVKNIRAEAPLQDTSVPHEISRNPVKKFAYNQVGFRWDESQWDSFNNIIEHESRWDCNAQNPASSAYGCAQFLDSTWADVGYEKTEDPYVQIMAAIEYVDMRYGTPDKAWSFWKENSYY